MKLVTFHHRDALRYGAVLAEGLAPAADMPLLDLTDHLPWPDLKSLIAAGGIDQARLATDKHAADRHLGEVRLARPIPDPEKIVCVGVNYAERNEEYKDGQQAPGNPSLFIRFPDSLVAHGEPLRRPPESDQLDYEGEIVLVIGSGGRRIPQDQAHRHIAGLTIMNEGTLRDWLRHGKFNVTQGKNFVASGALGPWIVPTADCPDLGNLSLTTRVNGEVRQQDNTRRMMFPFARLIAYISTFMLLKPGDLIATGTPTGAGARFDPPRWLVPGDTVEITVDGVGQLSNPVADE